MAPSDTKRAGSERRLAAIMFTDIVGYTALMAESEETGLRVRERHREIVRPLVERHHGDWIESPGDQSLSTFPSAHDAANCALAIQKQLGDEPELKLHIGIHSGDIVIGGGEISGDGLNIAARLCALSEGGGIRGTPDRFLPRVGSSIGPEVVPGIPPTIDP